MGLTQFDRVVRSTEELESLIGVPSELVIRKQLAELDQHMGGTPNGLTFLRSSRRFIEPLKVV